MARSNVEAEEVLVSTSFSDNGCLSIGAGVGGVADDELGGAIGAPWLPDSEKKRLFLVGGSSELVKSIVGVVGVRYQPTKSAPAGV